jgi:hypothetical protein
LRERFPQRIRVDAEVRRRPDDAAVAHEERLRRLVTNTEPGRDRVRHLAMRLYGHHGVARIVTLLGKVGEQLIQGFGTDAARITVLEQQQRAMAGLHNGAIELVNSVDRRQVWMHVQSV